ncbi:MAG: hypothetical protein II649_01760 [Kiritimatiellae bacterium]|nr:hypothetical protein [Kiritimatiellia bacterium]
MEKRFAKFALLAAVAAGVLAAAAQGIAPNRPSLLRRGGLGNRMNRPGAAQAATSAADAKPIADQLRDMPKGTNGVPLLDFDNAPVEILLMSYAKEAGKVLLPAPNLPKTQITLSSNGRELDKDSYLQAIEVTLTMNGIVIEPFGDIFLRAFERKTVRTQGIRTLMNVATNGIPERGRVISQLIRLEHITAEEAQKAVEGFKDPNGLFQVFERNNAILVTDTQENVNRMLEIIKELDVPTPVLEEVFVREIKYAIATDIKTYLETIVTESQKDSQKPGASVKSSGAPGFSRPSIPTQPSRLLNLNNRPGTPPPAPTPNAVLTAAISDADRGMIRGKVLIVADERSNKLIIITAKANMDFFDKVITTLDVETTPEVSVDVIRLKYADAEDVASMLNDLIGASSNSQSKNNQNANANRTGAANHNLTQNRPGAAPRPQTANPTFAGNTNLGELNKDNIKILADKRINGIVVMARKADMAAVKRVIDDMDVKLSQVLLETVIIQVELGDDLQTGVDWVQRGRQKEFKSEQVTDSYGRKLFWEEVTDDYGNTRMRQTTTETANPVMKTIKSISRDGFYNNGSYMLGGGGGSGTSMLGTLMNAAVNSTTNEGPIGGGLNYFLKSDKLNIASVIQAAKSDSRTKVLASPILMTLDNKEATIEATDMIYLFSGYQYSGSTYSGSQVRNYEKRDIGLTVKVTPRINPNGTVVLEIEEKFETQGADQNVPNESGGTDPYATVTTRKMQSEVTVENQQTIMMGGLTKKSNVQSESGIPLLKDIPWIGRWLFGSVSIKEARSELLVFITPYVLDDAAASQAEALRRKKSLSDPRPWDDNGWSLSPLADPVSKKEQLRRKALEWANQDEEHETGKKLDEAKEKRVKDLEERADRERKEWADKHAKEVQRELKRYEQEQLDWREFIDKLRKDKDDKAEKPGSAPAAKPEQKPAPEQKSAPAPSENLLEALGK